MTSGTITKTQIHPKLKILFLFSITLLVFLIIYFFLPVRTHWIEIYRPATLRILSGRNPYDGINFFNPPWALIPLIPIAILPEKLGNAILGTITLFSFGYTAFKLGAKPLTIFFFLTSPITLYNLIQVNVDWLIPWGLLLPPQIGLFFILIKPQLGAFLALYWFYDSWKKGGIRLVF